MAKWPVAYTCKLMEPGIISYEDSGAGIALVKKETIDRLCQTAVGRPVVIRHQKVTPENIQDVAVGYMTRVYFNPADAWHYVEFLITSDEVEPIECGDGSIVFKAPDGQILDGISGAYDVTNTAEGGVWHDIQFDAEILDGSFTHLALVINPRYEETNKIRQFMPSMLVNGKMPKNMNSKFKVGMKVRQFSGVEFKQEMTVTKIQDGLVWVKAPDGKEIGPFEAPLENEKKNATREEMLAEEKKQHPDFTDEQIAKIVDDHLKEVVENAGLDQPLGSTLKTISGYTKYKGYQIEQVGESKFDVWDGSRKVATMKSEQECKSFIDEKKNAKENYKENSKGGDIMNKIFKLIKQIANGKTEEDDSKEKVVSVNGKDVPLQDLINSYVEDQEEEKKKKDAENAKKNALQDDDEVEVGDKKMKIEDLKNAYAAKMAKKNEKTDEEEKKAKAEAEKKNAEDKEKEEKQNAISRAEAQDLFEVYAKEYGGPDGEAFFDNPTLLTPQKISEWLKSKGKAQADVNAVIGVWKSELQGSKKNSKAEGQKFFNDIENAHKNAVVIENQAGPRTRVERAEIGKSRYGSKNK